VVRLGVPLVDGYLEFLAGRCRPNTVLAADGSIDVEATVVMIDKWFAGESVLYRLSPFRRMKRTALGDLISRQEP
jgi:hypothetical protein